MTKPFFTYEQQLNKLQIEKNLIISDIVSAQHTLEKLSYYSLINGYKHLFKHTPSQKYIYGVTFDELVSFYYFDEELRSLFMKYILHVERHMKSLLSYHFCEKYGEQDTAYLNRNNYSLSKKNCNQINRLVHSLQKAISLPSPYAYLSPMQQESIFSLTLPPVFCYNKPKFSIRRIHFVSLNLSLTKRRYYL